MKTSLHFLLSLILLGLMVSFRPQVQPTAKGHTWSVNGKLKAKHMGITLSHEHIMSNFGGEADYDPGYDREALMAQVVPYLRKVRTLGVETIFDCTTAWFGRDVQLLKALADSSGLQLVTNTGYYGAANDRYVPQHAYKETIEQLAARWTAEFEEGIDGTGIRPGFIKLAFDGGAPSEIDLKLFRAGIQTHLATGLTMAVHTSNNPEAAFAQIDLLEGSGVHPSAWIWTHANKVEEAETLLKAARRGAWISLDGVRAPTRMDTQTSSISPIEHHLNLLKAFKNEGLLGQVLLSHDGNSFPRGGAIRPYDAIFTHLLPELEKAGFTEKEVEQMLIDNPAKAFAVRVRKL